MLRSLLRPRHHHGIRTVTVLAPIEDDRVDETESNLKRVGNGTSPFRHSDRTHFARLLVLRPERTRFEHPRGMRRYARIIDLVAHFGRAQREDRLSRPYLLFSAGYDDSDPTADAYRDDHSSYVEHLRRSLGRHADQIWGHCVDYPAGGWRDAAGFGDFMADRTTRAAYIFAPREAATVPRVRAALELRRRVTELAVATQHASEAQLCARYDQVFQTPLTMPIAPIAPIAPVAPAPPAAEDGRVDENSEWNPEREPATDDDTTRYAKLPRARPVNEVDLTDVQGLTVGYPTHQVATFVFLRVTDAGRARAWLARTPVTTAAQAKVVIAGRYDPDGGDDVGDPEVARHVAVSHHGLEVLGIPETRRFGFDPIFRSGMARREHDLAPQQGVGSWQDPYRPPIGVSATIDVLVHLSAPDRPRLDAALAELEGELARSGGFEAVAQEDGRQMRDTTRRHGRPRYLEHFGFADGGSQPAFDGLRPSADDNLPTGELLLGHTDIDGDTAGATAPTDLALNGCYLAFRKLEQDVEAFHALGADDEARARLVGRRQNGVALTGWRGDDADYRFHAEDPDGQLCPIGSHVRRVNPRDSRPLAVGPADPAEDRKAVEPRLARRHRMLRRGIPYGDPLPATGERGLLFVALVGDIGRQYEFVQTQWMNEGHAFRLGSDPDVFSGIAGSGRKVTLQGNPPAFVELPRPVVTCRGGEYFLLPGVAALRALARG